MHILNMSIFYKLDSLLKIILKTINSFFSVFYPWLLYILEIYTKFMFT